MRPATRKGVPDTEPSVRIEIREDSDVVMTRKFVRELARLEGLSESSTESLATAASEVARNIVVHALAGEVSLWSVKENGRSGVLLIARDRGPGIADVERVMQDGYSTTNSLGLGLPSVRRLVDEFDLSSTVGEGTTVVLKKWAR